ncbi:non-ribosomal peptide synthetase [Magnetospirillum molischianum]|uniref:Pyochelin synthetase F n=1 Tax=Magnetospirillum molischianum DSM 120 TaxID=1150626 RepID=H8FS67_MAGML|nr:non-ribosomal peptide synthetase [Magnetospirillum molischianum]CCG41205.1 Pyochelin synthetase F [Magnetospirillum molischianum DSM 120]
MNVAKLVGELETLGVDLWAEDGRLQFRAPKGLLTEERMALLRSHKGQILALLSADRDVTVISDPAGRHQPFPLTEVQTAYLLGRQDPFGHGGVACHGYLEAIYSAVAPERLEAAWNQLIARHDMLRAVIAADGHQRVLAEVPTYRLTVSDQRGVAASALAGDLTATRAAMDHRLYPTEVWPLFELRLTRTDDGDILHVSLDALIADWASAGILFTELTLILDDRGDELPQIEIGFRDYLLAERRLRDSTRFRRDRRYWLERLDDLPPAPDLPRATLTVPGPARFVRHHARLSEATWNSLRQHAAARGLTASIPVLAAYAAVLQRWSRRQRFSLNLTLLNRFPLHPQVNALVGDFTSVSLLAVEATAGRRFAEQAARLGERLFDDLDHRLFSGIEVMREMARRRGREAALMPVVFTSAIGLGARSESGPRFGHGLTQTPQVVLDCQVRDDADGLEINWDVRQGVFPAGMIEDMFAALGDLLAALAAGGEAWDAIEPVSLPSWQAAERVQVNATAAPLPDGMLHHGVLAQAVHSPEATAVIAPGGDLSYGALVRRAAGVAEVLRAKGCVPGRPVAIVMAKGVEQVVAAVGVLLAGAAYLPVEASQPRQRRDRMLANAGVQLVLTQSWLDVAETLPADIAAVAVDTLVPAAAAPPPADAGDPDRLAYVIYTSGSTGEPKGVMVSHRAALNTIADVNRRFGVTGADRMLGLAQLSFDLSVYDLFGVLGQGATLVLPDPDRRADPSHWAELIARHGVTLWNSVPAQIQMLTSYLESEPLSLPSLRLALLSGDWIPVTLPDQIRRLIPDLTLIGLGGATEAAIWSNYHPITTVDPTWTSVPYGLPLANQGFRILDEALRDAPVWVTGSLCISGQGLASGYWNDPVLTAERFFRHPVDGQLLYRTGDLGRYRPGGVLEFLGREDGQVKIRGHRVEVGEVEAALLTHPAVAATAVVATGGGSTERSLLGFVEPARRRPGEAEAERQDWLRLTPVVRRFAEDQMRGIEPARLADYFAALREAALTTMMAAFIARGLFSSPDASHDVEEILTRTGVAPRHHWLARRWLGLLAEAGWLTCDPTDGRHIRRHAPVDAETVAIAWTRVEQVGENNGLCTPAFVAYHRAHAERLHALLSGEQTPFDLLFPEGRQEVALALYRDDVISRHDNQAVAALVNRIAARHPRGTPLRLLEFGAGTGATTQAVIPVLEGYDAEYLFTDITPFFLAEARDQFRTHPWVRFGRVDLDGDLPTQGIAPHSADIVLCAGMLNSTTDSAAALQRIATTIAPGGWLILTEPVADLPHILLTQGFMMEPADGDHSHGGTKFLSLEQWRELISAAGGDLLLALPEEESPLAACGMRMLAARFKVERERISGTELASSLAARLPAHMVPAHFQPLDRLPLTGNGKIDRAALAGWSPAAALDPGTAEAEAGNEDPLTAKLCALWAEALGGGRLEPDDNIYDHGADSLILARVAGRLREEVAEAQGFAYDTLLRQMLNEPTVAALARALRSPTPEQRTKAADPAEAVTAAPATVGSNALLLPFGGGEGIARVMFHAALGTMDYFQHLGRSMAAQEIGPVIGVAVADSERYLAHAPAELIERVADDYAARLVEAGHTRFQLVGYCLGGLLATEVGRRLLERGLEVRDLTLVDSIPMFIDTDEELAFEAIFVPNLNLDPVAAVFGPEVAAADVYRAIEILMTRHNRRIPAGAMGRLDGDPGLAAVAAAARRQAARPQDERLAAYAQAMTTQAGVPVGPELVPALFRVCRHSMQAARFEPPPYLGDMTYLRCEEQQSFGITAGVGHLAVPFWERVCVGAFRVIDVPGNHFSVVEPPHVRVVTDHLAAALRGTS